MKVPIGLQAKPTKTLSTFELTQKPSTVWARCLSNELKLDDDGSRSITNYLEKQMAHSLPQFLLVLFAAPKLSYRRYTSTVSRPPLPRLLA